MTSFLQSEGVESSMEETILVWKRFADGESLAVRVFAPAGHSAQAILPAVMFFHGGMWAVESSSEFVAWATHLANRGVVCLLPEYRTHACYQVTPADMIQDALDAWKWLHNNAAALGVDQESITLAGTDAGGLMALNAAMQPMQENRCWWKPRSKDVPPLQPASVAIFRGLIDTRAPEAALLQMSKEDSMNPCVLLRRYLPPLFCAQGMQDPLQDFEMREWFCEQWRAMGNDAEFVPCLNGDHTLTHFEVNPVVFEQILLAWENFMADRGIWPRSVVEEPTLV